MAESSSQDAASRAACVQSFADPVQISTYIVPQIFMIQDFMYRRVIEAVVEPTSMHNP